MFVYRPRLVAALTLVILLTLTGNTAAESPSEVPGIEGRPGVIQFIGSGPIDHGPPRPGFEYLSRAATTARAASEQFGDVEARIFPNPRPEGRAIAAATSLHRAQPTSSGLRVASSSPELRLSFDGLNHRDSLLAAGNISGEPPDQGLCAGNGYVLESVNSALRVFDTHGKPLTDPIALSQFYGYPPEFDLGLFGGATSFDISCYYDPDMRRWFHVAVTVDLDPETGDVTGANRLDLAVSRGPNPLGRWNHYAIPTQNDGTEGTPNHHCYLGPCFADGPRIGADRYGFYITTNEFGDLFGPSAAFSGVNLYAISKRQLARGVATPTIVQFEQFEYPFGGLAFRLWPAISPEAVYEDGANGTEYLVSNVECAECVGEDRLVVWAVTNTRSLEMSRPSPRLTSAVVGVQPYSVVPPMAEQPPGDIPLAECINDTSIETPFGSGCWQYIFFPQDEPGHNETRSLLDPGADIYQVYFAAGRLWTAQVTTIVLEGEEKTGIAYYILRPKIGRSRLKARVELEGQFGLANNHLIYPAVAATKSGKGVISFTVVGEDYYPSAAYTTLDPRTGIGEVHLAAAGVGPVDGFTGYAAFGEPFQRFGDYGAAAVDGDTIWIATEYIGQTCTLEEYLTDTEESPLFSCKGTRSLFANWGTRISKLEPDAEGEDDHDDDD